MDAHAAAIEDWAGRLRGFVRDRSCKLLHVVAATELRRAVVAAAMAVEHAPENRAPFVVFAQPHLSGDPGWTARAEAAGAQHDARRDGAEPPIPALGPAPRDGDPRVAFAARIQQIVHASPPGAEGLVVVLAPTVVQAAKSWAEAVGLLVGGRRLDDVRWIVVDVEASTISPIVAALGERAVQHDARLPADAGITLLQRLIDDDGAGPRGVVPPPRRDVPPPATSPEAVTRRLVRADLLRAALALARGDATEAIVAQRQARDRCRDAGWSRDAITMEVVLGAQLLATGQSRLAEDALLRAIEAARLEGLHAEEAIAGMSLAAARAARGERHTALVAHAEASQAAERSGDPMLAIEGSRLAAQAAAELGMEPQAIAFYSRALKLAEGVPEVAMTSAPTAARALAAICRKRGLRDRAAELSADAERMAATTLAPEIAAPGASPPVAPDEAARPLVPEAAATRGSPAFARDDAALDRPAFAPVADGLLGRLSVPAEQLHALPEATILVDWRAPAPRLPEGTVLLDGAVPLPHIEGTILLDDLFGPNASAPAFDEGTGLMTLDEIARLHWGGDASSSDPPREGTRSWTADETATLQRAVDDALQPEATILMTPEELAALRGRPRPAGDPHAVEGLEPMPPRAPVAAERVDAPEDPIPGLEPLPPRRPAATGRPRFDGDEVTILTRTELAALLDALPRKPSPDEQEDE